MRRERNILVFLFGVGLCGPVCADNGDSDGDILPDAEFIEFLGSWEGDDDVWRGFFESLPALAGDDPIDNDGEDRRATSDSD